MQSFLTVKVGTSTICLRMRRTVHDTAVLQDDCNGGEIPVETGHVWYLRGLQDCAFTLPFIYTPFQGPRMYVVPLLLLLSQ